LVSGAATFSSSVTADGGASEGSIRIERDTVGTNTVIGSLAFTNNNSATTYGKVFGGRNSAGDGYVALGTGVSNNLYALESGNVGIGTSSPARLLSLYATTPVLQFINPTTGITSNDGTQLYQNAENFSLELQDSGYFNIFTGGTERMRIYSTGGLNILNSTGDPFCIQFNSGFKLRATSATEMGVVNATITAYADLRVANMTKASGSFRINHPLESLSETHDLVHSFVEAPKADLIYRGKVTLINGEGQANIDEMATMTKGTFEALCREVQCFTTNESGWDLVKGKVIGNIIYIESQNPNSTDEISWMVIGERKDKEIKESIITDDEGNIIVEPLKEENSFKK
jgi:hypothetical protein